MSTENFTQTFLYIKRHRKTGLYYFGKTTKRNPEMYRGSGKYWKRHLKIHGNDVETIWYCLFLDKETLQEFATIFSEMNNISTSNEWANLINENGLDGMPFGTKHSNEAKIKMSLSKNVKFMMKKEGEN